MDKKWLSHKIKQLAIEHGFEDVRIAKATKLTEVGDKLEKWLSQNAHGEMAYMENHFEIRIDPSKLVEGAKSIICLVFNYYPSESNLSDGNNKLARYAYGEDYHHVLRKKLKDILSQIKNMVGAINGRVFVDSAPILEREWAERSGLGWNGKNTLLIHPKRGSYYFLSEIILDIELEYDPPFSKNHCGTCTKCIDACPTQAIKKEGYWLDASKCISYLTIELKKEMPQEYLDSLGGWIYGCDICQEVCPWNRFSVNHSESMFDPSPELNDINSKEWIEITEEIFDKAFKRSPIKRTGYKKLMNNIHALNNPLS